jgi:hypothetical protein
MFDRDLDMGERIVTEIVKKYISNQLPICLLRLPEMKLVRREAMWKYIQPSLKEIVNYHDLMSKQADEIRNFQADTDEKRRERVRMEWEFIGQDYPELWKDLEYGVTMRVTSMVKEKMAYAIFSHRWLDEGEVTHSEMAGNARPFGAGFDKLKRFCDFAMEYDCRWAWADTCCIDKTSSAELEESIRSMYNWYANSRVCIVHLRDTINIGDMGEDPWFTRGWTLQELIAPCTIKFLNKNWGKIITGNNDKENSPFLNHITNITGINYSSLRHFFPKSANRDLEPLIWASRRRTTRVEDMAYCLIGIFRLSLPIAYGEGKRAFFRLQMELLQTENETNLLAWHYGEPSEDHPMIAGGPECFRDWHYTWTPGFREDMPAEMMDQDIKLTCHGLRLRLPKYDAKCTMEMGGGYYELEVEELTLKLQVRSQVDDVISLQERFVIVILGWNCDDLGMRVVGLLMMPTGNVKYGKVPTDIIVGLPFSAISKPPEVMYF